MLTTEQLAMRRTGLSATDMTVLTGTSPYAGRTPHDVYLAKVTDTPPSEQTRAMALGNLIEPVALKLLADERRLVIRPGETERHPILSWVVATPDGSVLADDERVAVAEAKAVGFRMVERWGDDGDPEGVPDEVRVQVAWQMIAARVRRAHVVAILGTDVRFYDVDHDEDLACALLEMGEQFWTRHVVARRPPDVDGTEGAARMIRGLFRRARTGIVPAPPGSEALIAEYSRAAAALKVAEAARDEAKTRLCAAIGDAEGIETEDAIATWKERAGAPKYKELAKALGASEALIEQYRGDPTRVLDVRSKRRKREAA